MSFTGVYCWNF